MRSTLSLCVLCAICAGPVVHGTTRGAAQSPPLTLLQVHADGSQAEVVITLRADGPISGSLARIAGVPVRFFVDLRGVVPAVPARTTVGRGGVIRVRVALNQTSPPITRVVLDMSGDVPARAERGESDRELRIVVGSDKAGQESPGPARWNDLVERVGALLDNQAPVTSQPAQQVEDTAWAALERELTATVPSAKTQTVHFMLLQSVRLGRIAASERRARQMDRATAGEAGARLLLDTARVRLAELFPER